MAGLQFLTHSDPNWMVRDDGPLVTPPFSATSAPFGFMRFGAAVLPPGEAPASGHVAPSILFPWAAILLFFSLETFVSVPGHFPLFFCFARVATHRRLLNPSPGVACLRQYLSPENPSVVARVLFDLKSFRFSFSRMKLTVPGCSSFPLACCFFPCVRDAKSWAACHDFSPQH